MQVCSGDAATRRDVRANYTIGDMLKLREMIAKEASAA